MQRFPSGGTAPAGSLAPRAQHCLPFDQLKKRLGGIEYKGLLQWDAGSPTAILDAILTENPIRLKFGLNVPAINSVSWATLLLGNPP